MQGRLYKNCDSSQYDLVKRAASKLEEKEAEYPLDRLVRESGLERKDVLGILKECWVKNDFLNIVYLNLSREEENFLYSP